MKRLLSLLILISVLGVGIALSLSLYLTANAEFDKQLASQVTNVHQEVQQRFRVFDELIANDEKEIQIHANQVLKQLSKTLLQGEQDPTSWTAEKLEKLSQEHSVDAIYIIDPSTTVIATNFLPDLGFELGSISDTFKEYLLALYGTGKLEVDRINISSKTGIIKIYAYYAPKGSKYVLEVSYDVKKYLTRNRSSRYVDFMFGDFFTEMTRTNPLLESIDVYLVNNYAAFPFLRDTPPLKPDGLPEIPEGEVIEIKKGNTLHYYSRADLRRSRLHSADYLAIQSTFDLSPMYILLHKFISTGIFVVLGVMVLAYFIISFLFNKWILRRIFRIIVTLERSAEGDFSDSLPTDKRDELGLISEHINDMNRRISVRDHELREAQQTLEQRVTERTHDLQQEVEARKKAEKKMMQLAATDPLTGVLNRRAFDERSAEEIQRAIRYQRPLAVILLDLDHFKEVNDQYGHQCGDRVLVELANLIQPCLRSIDSLCRHGGEEFLILLPETGEDEAHFLAERLRKEIEKKIMFSDNSTFSITSSFGVASWAQKDKDILPSIHRADKALYKAKEAGRNLVFLYTEDDDGEHPLQ